MRLIKGPRGFALFLSLLAVTTFFTPSSWGDSATGLKAWLPQQKQTAWALLLNNISPSLPKYPGGPQAKRGIVVAALSTQDPDYYFHWIRDSSLIMSTVVNVYASSWKTLHPSELESLMGDYLTLSAELQNVSSTAGMGEPRFNIDGSVDTLPWSRPQFDGPALRAISVLKYLRWSERNSRRAHRALALEVVQKDLGFVLKTWDQQGYDIWEEIRADHYHTHLVQLAALEEGLAYFSQHHQQIKWQADCLSAIKKIKIALQKHWDGQQGFVRSQLNFVAPVTKNTVLDSAVIVAVMDAERSGHANSVLDPEIQSTVSVLGDYFRAHYAINQAADLGLAYGRYPGDVYVGGNPWYLITADFANFYYTLALRLKTDGGIRKASFSCRFLKELLSTPPCKDEKSFVKLDVGSRHSLFSALVLKADGILSRIKNHTPNDGQLSEQFDQVTGLPRSANGLTWSYAAFLEAALARERLKPWL